MRKVQNVLERDTPVFRQKRREYRMELETVRTQDLGGFAAVQLLSDYTNELEVACTDWMQKAQAAQEQLQQGADLGNTRTKELEELLQKKEEEQFKTSRQSYHVPQELVPQKQIPPKRIPERPLPR